MTYDNGDDIPSGVSRISNNTGRPIILVGEHGPELVDVEVTDD